MTIPDLLTQTRALEAGFREAYTQAIDERRLGDALVLLDYAMTVEMLWEDIVRDFPVQARESAKANSHKPTQSEIIERLTI